MLQPGSCRQANRDTTDLTMSQRAGTRMNPGALLSGKANDPGNCNISNGSRNFSDDRLHNINAKYRHLPRKLVQAGARGNYGFGAIGGTLNVHQDVRSEARAVSASCGSALKAGQPTTSASRGLRAEASGGGNPRNLRKSIRNWSRTQVAMGHKEAIETFFIAIPSEFTRAMGDHGRSNSSSRTSLKIVCITASADDSSLKRAALMCVRESRRSLQTLLENHFLARTAGGETTRILLRTYLRKRTTFKSRAAAEKVFAREPKNFRQRTSVSIVLWKPATIERPCSWQFVRAHRKLQ